MTPETILPVKDNSDDLDIAIRAFLNNSHGEGVVVARNDVPGARHANSSIPQARQVPSVRHDDCGTRALLAGPQPVAADPRRSKFIEDEIWLRA